MRRIDELFLKYPFYGSRRWCVSYSAKAFALAATGYAELMRLTGL